MKKTKSKKLSRWVVKVGSNLVCNGGPILMREWMLQVARLRREHGVEVIWVTSGAIASAVERTQYKKTNRTLSEKQALSAIGQPLLMDLYNLSLQATALTGAQILLSYSDIANETRRDNLKQTLNQLLEWEIVPILNENDAVATDEIKFGDNDSLSAKVACMLGAERLIILTDVEGFYESDPRTHPKAKRIAHLKKVTESILNQVKSNATSERGTGGMYSKLMAAREATSAGIETWLVKGDIPGILVSLALGEAVGTRVEKQ